MKTYVAIYKEKIYSFDSWPDCKEFVQDKKNIKYKGFESPEDIKRFVDSNMKKISFSFLPNTLYAFVASKRIRKENDIYISDAFILMKNNEIITTGASCSNESDDSLLVTITGENKAIKNAILEAIKINEQRLIIVYNFIGSEMWANGSWKPKNSSVSQYVTFINKHKKEISLDFIQIDKFDSVNTNIYSEKTQQLAQNQLNNYTRHTNSKGRK